MTARQTIREWRRAATVLCLRCKRGIGSRQWRQHVRLCFGIHKCRVCELSFPCRNRLCAWRFPDPPEIPTHLIPYFRASGGRRQKDENVKRPLEAEAHRWLDSLAEKT